MRKKLGQALRRIAGRIDPVAIYSPPDPMLAAVEKQARATEALASAVSDRESITGAVNTVCVRIVGPQIADAIDATRADGVPDAEILDTLRTRLVEGWF